MGSKITVFGSYVVDLMSRMSHLPVPGETVKCSMFRMGPGGKGFNQAVAAHKAGGSVTMVTKIGRDPFGDIALNTMRDLGMDFSRILISGTEGSGTALILVDENTSQNMIGVTSCACGTITKEDVDSLDDLLDESDFVLLQLEVNEDANEAFIRKAHEKGITIILNTAPVAPIKDDVLALCDIVTPNEVEAALLTGTGPITDFDSAAAAAAVFHRKGVPSVVITMGGKGAFLSSGGMQELIPPYPVNVIDTTGAGDAFSGGFVTAMSEGKTLHEAACFASALAALSVQKLGTTPSMPCRAEIDAFIETNGYTA
ncbi:MAG: ribokinase [Oscillospiraceae bacterium]